MIGIVSERLQTKVGEQGVFTHVRASISEPMQIFALKESVYIRKEFKSHRIGLTNIAAVSVWDTKMAAVSLF